MAVLDLADGGLGEIAQGGAAVVVRKVVVGVVSAMVATMLFGLFHYYASRWLRGDDRTD
jgi:hypothetical protein